MIAKLIFIHGRGQEGKEAADLTSKWLVGLNRGLQVIGLPPAAQSDVVFPFYADVLYDATVRLAAIKAPIILESLPERTSEAGPIDPWLGPEANDVERQMIRDMAIAAGVPPAQEEGFDALLSWGGARRALAALARRTRVDQSIIRSQLPDVAIYLTHARNEVLEVVKNEIPLEGEFVLVTHSLGTVVARDLLDDADIRTRTRLWVTAGSPLGLEAVQQNLLTPGHVHPTTQWVTTYDVNDIVALGHPLKPQYGAPLEDIKVENADEPHAIDRYLANPAVAEHIHVAQSSQ